MRDKITISVIIGIITTVFTVGGSFAVIKNKTDKIDKLEETVVTNDKKVAVLEIQLDVIDSNLKEQKEAVKDIKNDLREILREVKK